jgi:outer membrane protein OmpA-like peptidoglycan-associated protein
MKKQVITLLIINAFCLAAQQNRVFTSTPVSPTGTANLRSLFETLIGQGIILKNYSITRRSSADAYGFFEDGAMSLGMRKGLLMATGGITALPSANTMSGFTATNHNRLMGQAPPDATYSELANLLPHHPQTYDACVVEIDVVPTADTLSFNYVFGSEEYDEYVGSQFNDVFGFFISGEGITGEKNLAVLPGTDTPVSINSINGGNGAVVASNPSFFVSNNDGHLPMEFDGFTRLMQIRQPVVPYKTYHIKMAIADVGDEALESGVLIEGKSFISYEKSYNVLFEPNSSTIEQGYKTMLDNFTKTYYDQPQNERGKILVTGHTDGDGADELNEKLSHERAAEVRSYLRSRGISDSNMLVDSKGEHMPRADNYSDEGKSLNRRVEIKMCGGTAKYVESKALLLDEQQSAVNRVTDNFPNPFEQSTTLRSFILPETRHAMYTVMDGKGKLVRAIHVLERGVTETLFTSDNLPAGFYMATLLCDGVVAGNVRIIKN